MWKNEQMNLNWNCLWISSHTLVVCQSLTQICIFWELLYISASWNFNLNNLTNTISRTQVKSSNLCVSRWCKWRTPYCFDVQSVIISDVSIKGDLKVKLFSCLIRNTAVTVLLTVTTHVFLRLLGFLSMLSEPGPEDRSADTWAEASTDASEFPLQSERLD